MPFLVGVIMELCQKYLTTYRGFETADICNNLIGCLAASLVVYVYVLLRNKQ